MSAVGSSMPLVWGYVADRHVSLERLIAALVGADPAAATLAAITVTLTSSPISSSITVPKMMLASWCATPWMISAAAFISNRPIADGPVMLSRMPRAPSMEDSRRGLEIALRAAPTPKAAIGLAIEMVREHRMEIHATILDMHMPGMGGVDAAQLYRVAHPESAMPFILLTADATTTAARMSEEAGIDAFLTKPIRPSTLRAAVLQLTKEDGLLAEPSPTAAMQEVPALPLTRLNRATLDELAAMNARREGFLDDLVQTASVGVH